MEFRCPNCQAPIYSRKNKICGVCEKPLPAGLLFTEEQIKKVNKEIEMDQKRSAEFNLPGSSDSSDPIGII